MNATRPEGTDVGAGTAGFRAYGLDVLDVPCSRSVKAPLRLSMRRRWPIPRLIVEKVFWAIIPVLAVVA